MRRVVMVLGLVLVAGALGGWRYKTGLEARREATRAELASFASPKHYDVQRVVYHFTEGGGLFGRRHLAFLGTLANHVRAVGPGRLDARVILQGDGVGLLTAAKSDDEVRRRMELLSRNGVRFEVCQNSLIDRGLALRDLQGVSPESIVPAAVAEIAALEASGFIYIRM